MVKLRYANLQQNEKALELVLSNSVQAKIKLYDYENKEERIVKIPVINNDFDRELPFFQISNLYYLAEKEQRVIYLSKESSISKASLKEFLLTLASLEYEFNVVIDDIKLYEEAVRVKSDRIGFGDNNYSLLVVDLHNFLPKPSRKALEL